MNFGNTLLALRKQKNVTQEELASELGVTAAAISKWENNYTLPDIPMLCAIADYFQVTTDELLNKAREVRNTSNSAEDNILHMQLMDFVRQHGVPQEILNNIERKLQE